MSYVANVSTSRRRPAWRSWPPWPRWPPRGWAADVAFALVVAVFQVGGTFATAEYDDPRYRPLGLVAALLLLAGPLALTVRRRWPLAVLAASLVATSAYLARDHPVGAGTAMVAMFVAVYTAASTGNRLRSLLVFLVSSASFIAALELFTAPDSPASYVVFAGMLLAVVAMGEAARAHRRLRGEAEERAAQAERTREAEARRRVDEERVRIARELHDVLSHSISMMNVQAGVAAHLLDEQPEQARAALLAIKQARTRCGSCARPSACSAGWTTRRPGPPRPAWRCSTSWSPGPAPSACPSRCGSRGRPGSCPWEPTWPPTGSPKRR
ncbi:MAG: hypothetical protein GEV03_03550 [Streptosporangiales bacterium]|nr:hypothetical protein [Streptosporangiales bacterium]